MIPPWQVKPVPARPRTQGRQIDQHGEEQASVAGSADAALADATLVRPFLVTGGRTRPLQDGLRIETLVYARPAALSAPLRFELRRIVELCQTPLAVAEVAVRLGVPLGVARVLVADLLSGGYVTCEQPAEIPIDVIERIRDRVRAL